jgi:hypothetical protein
MATHGTVEYFQSFDMHVLPKNITVTWRRSAESWGFGSISGAQCQTVPPGANFPGRQNQKMESFD